MIIFVAENRNPCVFISITAGGDAARFQGQPWRQLSRGGWSGIYLKELDLFFEKPEAFRFLRYTSAGLG